MPNALEQLLQAPPTIIENWQKLPPIKRKRALQNLSLLGIGGGSIMACILGAVLLANKDAFTSNQPRDPAPQSTPTTFDAGQLQTDVAAMLTQIGETAVFQSIAATGTQLVKDQIALQSTMAARGTELTLQTATPTPSAVVWDCKTASNGDRTFRLILKAGNPNEWEKPEPSYLFIPLGGAAEPFWEWNSRSLINPGDQVCVNANAPFYYHTDIVRTLSRIHNQRSDAGSIIFSADAAAQLTSLVPPKNQNIRHISRYHNARR